MCICNICLSLGKDFIPSVSFLSTIRMHYVSLIVFTELLECFFEHLLRVDTHYFSFPWDKRVHEICVHLDNSSMKHVLLSFPHVLSLFSVFTCKPLLFSTHLYMEPFSPKARVESAKKNQVDLKTSTRNIACSSFISNSLHFL